MGRQGGEPGGSGQRIWSRERRFALCGVALGANAEATNDRSGESMILTVETQFTLTSAGDLMRDIRAGLWQTLERKSAMSGKPFPAGSNVVMVTYLSDGEQLS